MGVVCLEGKIQISGNWSLALIPCPGDSLWSSQCDVGVTRPTSLLLLSFNIFTRPTVQIQFLLLLFLLLLRYFDWLVEAIHLVSKSTLSSFFSELFFLHNFSKSTLWWKRQKVKDNLWKVSPSLKQWNVIKRQHLAIILVLVFVFFTCLKNVFFNLFKLFCISNLLKLFCVFLVHQFGTFLVCLNFVNFESLEWGQPATIYQYTGFGPLPDLWTKPVSELKSNTK